MPEYIYYNNLRKHTLRVLWPTEFEEELQNSLDNYFAQEKLAYEAMKGQYFTEEEQQNIEDRKKYPLFSWRKTCVKHT